MSVQTETRPVTPEVTTPIKPSEALRLGRLLRPIKTVARCFDGDNGACANGAIALGLGYDGPTNNDTATYWWLSSRGLSFAMTRDIFFRNDGVNGFPRTDDDAAVLAYLEERGL